MTLVFLPPFVSLRPNLDWVVTRLLETTNLIRCTERFPLVLTGNKPVYNLALAPFINVGLLLTYYSLMPSPAMPTDAQPYYAHPVGPECFNARRGTFSTSSALNAQMNAGCGTLSSGYAKKKLFT